MLKYNSNNKNIPTTELILNIEALTVLLHEDKLKKNLLFGWIGF